MQRDRNGAESEEVRAKYPDGQVAASSTMAERDFRIHDLLPVVALTSVKREVDAQV